MSGLKRNSNLIGSIACIIFALLALALGGHMAMQLQRMESIGFRTDAVVTGIKTGAKNSKYAIVSFKTANGVDVQSKCLFQMFAIRQEIGDAVTALYDPSKPEIVMIDNGIWNWDQPLFCLLSGGILLVLAVIMLRSQPKRNSAS